MKNKPVNLPGLFCGECLIAHVAVVPLEGDGSCLCCKSGHKPKPRDVKENDSRSWDTYQHIKRQNKPD